MKLLLRLVHKIKMHGFYMVDVHFKLKNTPKLLWHIKWLLKLIGKRRYYFFSFSIFYSFSFFL